MNNEIPTLTFEPYSEEESTQELLNKEMNNEIEKVSFDESILSQEEMKMVDDFVNQIDLYKSHQILQYGVGSQKKDCRLFGDSIKQC